MFLAINAGGYIATASRLTSKDDSPFLCPDCKSEPVFLHNRYIPITEFLPLMRNENDNDYRHIGMVTTSLFQHNIGQWWL